MVDAKGLHSILLHEISGPAGTTVFVDVVTAVCDHELAVPPGVGFSAVCSSSPGTAATCNVHLSMR